MEENIIVEVVAEPREMRVGTEEKLMLQTAANWAKFIAIAIFVCCGLGLLCIILATIASTVAGLSSYDMGYGSMLGMYDTMMWSIFILYFVLLVAQMIPPFYLLRFSQRTKDAIAANDQASMLESFINLRSYMKAAGIILIVNIALGVLFSVGIAIVSAMGI
jgi:uncharacterized membrane protein